MIWVSMLKEYRPLSKSSSIFLILLCLALLASANPGAQVSSDAGAAASPAQTQSANPEAKPAQAPAPSTAAPSTNAPSTAGKQPPEVKSTSPSAPFESGTVINVHT